MRNGRARIAGQHLVKSQPSGVTQREWQAAILGKDSGGCDGIGRRPTLSTLVTAFRGGDSKLSRLFSFTRQASKFVGVFVGAKSKGLGSIGNTKLQRVLHRPPFSSFYQSKFKLKYAISQELLEGNTVLYRAALISKHTADDRHSTAQFVGVLLESRKLISEQESYLKNMISKAAGQSSIIARRITDYNTQDITASHTTWLVRGIYESLYQSERHRHLQSKVRQKALLV